MEYIVHSDLEIAEELFDGNVVDSSLLNVLLGQFDDGIKDVRSARDCSKQQFTYQLAVAECHLLLEDEFVFGVNWSSCKF